jgi:hypothetical protein
MSASGLEPQAVEDLTLFIAGGWAAVINNWLIEAPDPLDVPAFGQRLIGIFLALVGGAAKPFDGDAKQSPDAGSRLT